MSGCSLTPENAVMNLYSKFEAGYLSISKKGMYVFGVSDFGEFGRE